MSIQSLLPGIGGSWVTCRIVKLVCKDRVARVILHVVRLIFGIMSNAPLAASLDKLAGTFRKSLAHKDVLNNLGHRFNTSVN